MRLVFALAVLTAAGIPGFAAESGISKVGQIETRIIPAEAKPGQVVTFEVTVAPKAGAWTYPVHIPPGQVGSNSIRLPKPGDLIFVGEVVDPPGAKTKPSPTDPFVEEKYYPYPARPTWKLTAVVSPLAKPGKKTVPLTGTRIQVCDKSSCYDTDVKSPPTAELTILDSPALDVPSEFAKAVQDAIGNGGQPNPPPTPVPSVGETSKVEAAGLVRKAYVPEEQYLAELESLLPRVKSDLPPDATTSGGVWGLLIAAAFWGFVSLVTPCVFPMIPITVSLFLKQSHQSTVGAVKLAGVYSLTIVLVLGAAAVSLLSVFQVLSNQPFTNLVLGGLFVFFALSLFGMYDIQLPGFLLRYTEKRRGAGGLIGTVFGALAFSIVSFTCVAPFLGGFAGLAASNQFGPVTRALAGLTFAAAFASPFFILALFPSLIKKLPKSGGWLDSVKVMMGFLEMAAALKFLRSAEILWSGQPTYLTYDVVLAGWVAIAAAAGLYCLNVYRLPHDEEQANIGVGRLLVGLGFLGLAIYLTPGLLKTANGQSQRPAGIVYAWVDAFLLPEPGAGGETLSWSTDLKATIDQAVKEKRLVFVDFTGVNCSNCKLNEKNVFPKPEIQQALQKYARVQLYADFLPPEAYLVPPDREKRELEASANLNFQEKAFGTVARPTYVILDPRPDGTIRVVGKREGAINDTADFAEFLRKPLEGK